MFQEQKVCFAAFQGGDAGAVLGVLQVHGRDGLRGPRQLCLQTDAHFQEQKNGFRVVAAFPGGDAGAVLGILQISGPRSP